MARIKQCVALVLVAIAAAAVCTASPAQAGFAPTSSATRLVATQSSDSYALVCRRGYYKNVSGHCVRRPSSDPRGATARCSDGSYSYSEHASGTCSHHGGVARWIHHPE